MTLEGTIRHGMSLSTECVSDVMVIAFGPIGSFVDLSGYYTKGEVNEMFSHVNIETDDSPTEGSSHAVSSGGVYTALAGKVDKENGKGLSSNDYTDAEKEKLAGIESGSEANVQSDWNESNASSDAYIKNKPALANVATSGSYDDLTNKPTIPAQAQSDWNESDSSDPGYIKNKPTIPAAQVNADWNASSGVAQILNKPTIPTVPTNVGAFNNDAGYLTQHQSLANYYTKSEVNSAIVDSNPVIVEGTRSGSMLTAVAPFAELMDKQKITLWLNTNLPNYVTLNLTLSDGTTTGAKQVWGQSAGGNLSQVSGSYWSNCPLEIMYDATHDRWITVGQRDTNNILSTMNDNVLAAGTSTTSQSVTAKLLRDNFYLKSEINTTIGDIETLLASI